MMLPVGLAPSLPASLPFPSRSSPLNAMLSTSKHVSLYVGGGSSRVEWRTANSLGSRKDNSHLWSDPVGSELVPHSNLPKPLKANSLLRLCTQEHWVCAEDIDLSQQNVIHATEVAASLKFLHALHGSDACDPSFLQSVAQTTNEDALQEDAVIAVVSAAWQQCRVWTALDVTLGIVSLLLLVAASHALRHGQQSHGAQTLCAGRYLYVPGRGLPGCFCHAID